MPPTTPALDRALEDFAAYARTDLYRREERDYKQRLLETLGAALTDESLGLEDFPERLHEALRRCGGAVDNLTHWTANDSLKKYLAGPAAGGLRAMFRALFDERRPISERVDEFQRALLSEYERHNLPPKTSWIVSVFLASRYPQSYTFYRPTAVRAVCRRWGLAAPQGRTKGEKFAAYVGFLGRLRGPLAAALGRDPGLVDAHSFLWYSFRRSEGVLMTDWREKLRAWLQTNPRQMPPELRRLREEFVERFPKERLGELTLERYALGHEATREGFCYWLEFKTKRLGRLGGTSAKFGVWWGGDGWRWNSIYRDPEEALARIKSGLSELVRAAEGGRFEELDAVGAERLGPSRYGLRCKPLYLYFPDEFLPIWQPDHLAHFLGLFGAEAEGDVLARNRQLLRVMRARPEFEGFDTWSMIIFLYDSFPPPKESPEEEDEAVAPPPAPAPRELKELLEATARTRNVLLYGPPGTGKTWLVNHFTNYFLLLHNVSPEAADAYWRAKDAEERRALRARVREEAGDASEQPSFWWMVASDAEEWRWSDLFERGEWFFGKRNLARNFEEAKAGDFIFGYRARPHKQIVALARVEEGLETRVEDGLEKEGITIRPVKMLTQPLGWGEIKANPLLKNSEPVKMNIRGTMFRLNPLEAQELARLLNEKGNRVELPAGGRANFTEFITFHQSFAYEEFVEGLKPAVAGGALGYEIVPGVFRRICADAEAEWRARGAGARKYLLVVDEINRANIAKVLGELITLVEDDKRLGEANEVRVRLPYSGESFGVPPNLYVLGTMNTADRSIALLDLALRRRFTFVEMMPDPSAVEPALVAGVDLRALLTRLNERIAQQLDRDHQIGHSYFMKLADADDLRFAWYKRVVPLLQEYFYNDGERLRGVIGPKFVPPAAGGTGEQSERERGEVERLDGDEFLAALRELAAGGARETA